MAFDGQAGVSASLSTALSVIIPEIRSEVHSRSLFWRRAAKLSYARDIFSVGEMQQTWAAGKLMPYLVDAF